MRTLYKVLLGFIPLLLTTAGFAQTTITTVGPTYDGVNNCGNGSTSCYITFVVNNTNTSGIILTGVGNYTTSANTGNTVTLFSSTTSLSGPVGTLPNAAFTQVATGTVGTITTSGVNPVLTNLNIVIPAATQVRFLLQLSGTTSYSGNSTIGAATPNTFTMGGGVLLHNGDYAIGGLAVGYGGTNTPRSFTGSITFVPTVPCTSPPTAGTTTVSATQICAASSIQVGLSGNSQGTGQTYQLLTASSAAGPYSTVGAPQGGSNFTANPTTTTFYRIRVVCGTGVDTSAPVQVTVYTGISGTFTINNASPTAGTNFNNFTDAVSALTCGIAGPVVFNVVNNATPYTDQVTIPNISTTSSTNTITFNGNGATINFTSTNSSLPAAFNLTGADWIRIKRLNITANANSTYGFGVLMTGNANNNIVDSCNILVDSNTISTSFTGIAISGSATSATTSGSDCDSNTITNNTINGGYYGITLLGGTSAATASLGNVISGNTIKNSCIYGIYTGYIGNTLIERNDISRPTRNNYETVYYGIYHVSTTGAGTSVRISRNRIHDPSGTQPTAEYTFYGIYSSATDATAAAPHEISNNLLYNLRLDGPLYGIFNSSSDHVKYWHNTVSVNDQQSSTIELTRGFHQTTAAAGIELKNNIFSITRGGTGIKHGVYWNTTIAAANAYSARNNVYHVINPGATGGVARRNSTNFPTLAAYQTASLQDTGSIEADPLFASPVNNNFAPNASAVNNIGVPLPQVPIDIFGTTRSTTAPDPGAIEFTPVACTTPLAAGVAIADDTTVCVGTTVNFDAPGVSFGTGQTYQWQTSPTLAGTYTNVGNSSSSQTSYSQVVNTTTYFRLSTTCGATTTYSTPVRVQTLGTLAGGTYTINAGAPASVTNFQSFTAAVDAMQCGITGPVVLNVVSGSGPYNEQVIFPPTISGTSSTNTITINGNNNAINFNTLFPNINGLSYAGILLNGVDWVTINNVVVNVTGTGPFFGFGIQMHNNADNNTISGCTVNIDSSNTMGGYVGIVVSGSLTDPTGTGSNCDSVKLVNNAVNGGYYGITLMGSSSVYSNGNLIKGNRVRNPYFYGIYSGYVNETTIDSNDISRPTRTTFTTFAGVYIPDPNTNLRITRNRIHDPAAATPTSASAAYGIYHTSGDATAAAPCLVANNLIYNFRTSGTIYGLYNSGSDYITYRHNTVALDDTTHTGSSITRGLYQTTAATGIDVRNNIFSLRRTGSGNKIVLHLNTAGTATTFTSNHNDLYVNGGTGTNEIGRVGTATAGTGYTTLSAWQSGAGKDTNSVDLNPEFAGGATGSNMTPTNSAVDNLGQPIGITVDAFGNPRSLITPDMGAIEWSFIPPCAVPTALTDAAAATTASTAWTASISTNASYEHSFSTSSATPTVPGTPVGTTSTSLSGLTPGTTYYWFVRTVCGPGSYSPWVMDSFTTCTPPASTLTAIGSPTPTTAISICQGDTAFLKAPGGVVGNTYLFLRNGATAGSGVSSDSVFQATQAGSYTVVVTNAFGCYDTSDAVQVTVNPLPNPIITQLSFNQLSTTTAFTSYQWNLAGAPISGATAQTLTTSTNGSYTVTVTDANGCRATSGAVNLTTASVGGAAATVATIRVFPNPTTSVLFIESSVPVTAQVWTLDGRKLMEMEKATRVDLSGLASGVYSLRLTDVNGNVLATERVTKMN